MGATEYCLLWIDWWPMCMDKAQWAAWVQAIGAIVGIAIAFWIGHRDGTERKRQAAVELVSQLSYAHEVLIYTRVVLAEHIKWVRSTKVGNRLDFGPDTLEAAMPLLTHAMERQHITSPLPPLLNAQNELRRMVNFFSVFSAAPLTSSVLSDFEKEGGEHTLAVLDDSLASLDILLQEARKATRIPLES